MVIRNFNSILYERTENKNIKNLQFSKEIIDFTLLTKL